MTCGLSFRLFRTFTVFSGSLAGSLWGQDYSPEAFLLAKLKVPISLVLVTKVVTPVPRAEFGSPNRFARTGQQCLSVVTSTKSQGEEFRSDEDQMDCRGGGGCPAAGVHPAGLRWQQRWRRYPRLLEAGNCPRKNPGVKLEEYLNRYVL